MPTRHEEIAETLTKEILRGRYHVGDRLPSERDLAALYSVHRGAVREALKKNPQYSLELMRVAEPYQDAAEIEHYLELLRRAGLPE